VGLPKEVLLVVAEEVALSECLPYARLDLPAIPR